MRFWSFFITDRELYFLVVQGVLPDRLGLPESQKSPKKVVQKRQNLSYSMIFTTKNTSDKKMSMGKKFTLRMSIKKSKPK